MGMSASQARLISLEARQSNLEYQGQQINQERTILSQQCTALYNSLLAMTVPTPPSTSDFTTVQYKGNNGVCNFTLGKVNPTSDGLYTIDINYETTGNCIKGGKYQYLTAYNVQPELKGSSISNFIAEIGYTRPKEVSSIVKDSAKEVTNDKHDKNSEYKSSATIMHSIDNASAANGLGNDFYYLNKAGNFVLASSYDDAKTQADANNTAKVYVATTIGQVDSKLGTTQEDGSKKYDWNGGPSEDFVYSSTNTKKYYEGGITADKIGAYTMYTAGDPAQKVTLGAPVGKDCLGNNIYEIPDNVAFVAHKNGTETIANPGYDEKSAQGVNSIAGKVPEQITPESCGDSYEKIIEAIKNTYPEYKNNVDQIVADFLVVVGEDGFSFVKRAQYDQAVVNAGNAGGGRVEVFSLEPNGSYTNTKEEVGCQITFDNSGRITQIGIPVYEDDVFTGDYNYIDLTAETVSDEAAYKDAYAEYEYQTYLYDQKNKEINAKTEIIQQEDRNLELKLTRLDNERTQIKTEIEAVKKVISDNIEGSYKTFSG